MVSAPTHFVVQAKANGKWTTVLRFQNQNEAVKAFRSYFDPDAEAVRLGAGIPVEGKLKWKVVEERSADSDENQHNNKTHNTKNKDIENKIENLAKEVGKFASLLFFIFGIYFVAKFIFSQKADHDDYIGDKPATVSDNSEAKRRQAEQRAKEQDEDAKSNTRDINGAAGIISQTLMSPGSFRLVSGNTLWRGKALDGKEARIVKIEYDAQNGFGALLRGCSFVSFKFAPDNSGNVFYDRTSGLEKCGSQEILNDEQYTDLLRKLNFERQ